VLIALLIDEVVYYKNLNFFWIIALVYAVCLIGISILSVIYLNIWQYLMTKYTFDIREKIYSNILNAKASYLSNSQTGDLVARIDNDTNQIMHIVQRNAFHFINGILGLVLSVVFVFSYSWQAGLLILIAVPIYYFISKKFGGKVKEQSDQAREVYRNYISWAYEMLKGLREIKLMSAEKSVSQKLISYYKQTVKVQIRSSVLQFKVDNIIGFTALIFNIALNIMAAIFVIRSNLSLGAAVAIFTYYGGAYSQLSYLINNNIQMQWRKASVDRIYNRPVH
jgi:ABC-type bacteriocin/lantibiotic exporter with double-glycine peptidase domain